MNADVWRKTGCLPYITLLILFVQTGFCQALAPPNRSNMQSSNNVSLDLSNVTLKDALSTLFRQAGKNYKVDGLIAKIQLEKHRTVHYRNISFDNALKSLLVISDGHSLPYHNDQGVYHIEDYKVELELKSVDPALALKALFDQADIDYAFLADIFGRDKIDFSIVDIPFDQALKQLIRILKFPSQISIEAHDGMIVLRPRNYDYDSGADTIFIKTRNIKRRRALQAALDAVNLNYVFAVDPKGSVSIEMREKFPGIVYNILRGALTRDTPLTYYYSDDLVFHLVTRDEGLNEDGVP